MAGAVGIARDQDMLFINSEEAVLFSDRQGRIVEMNMTASRLWPGAGIGRNIRELKINGLQQAIASLFARDQTAECAVFEAGGKNATGETLELEVNAQRIRIAGESLVMVRLKEIDSAVLTQRHLLTLARAMEQYACGVMITDFSANIVYVNEQFCRTSGYTQGDVIGNNARMLKSGAQSADFYRTMLGTVHSGGIWRGKLHNRKKTGELYWENVMIAPLRNANGEISHFMATKEDITLREEAAAVLRRANQKLRDDLTMAGKIQKTILPDDLRQMELTVQTIFEPLNMVSGDIYDYVWQQEQRRFVGYVADVMGHGLGAALQTSALMVLGRQLLQGTETLAMRVNALNRNLAPYLDDGSFAALLAFEIDLAEQTVRYVSAGINHFMTVHDGETMIVRAPGIFLGIVPELEYEEERLPCSAGDCFFFCSDGMMDLLSPERINEMTDFAATMKKMMELTLERTDDATVVGIRL